MTTWYYCPNCGEQIGGFGYTCSTCPVYIEEDEE